MTDARALLADLACVVSMSTQDRTRLVSGQLDQLDSVVARSAALRHNDRLPKMLEDVDRGTCVTSLAQTYGDAWRLFLRLGKPTPPALLADIERADRELRRRREFRSPPEGLEERIGGGGARDRRPSQGERERAGQHRDGDEKCGTRRRSPSYGHLVVAGACELAP